jgi:phage baseplate assembly protein W
VSKKYLGTGWGFPISPGTDGAVEYVSEEQKIQQSVLIILGTAKGERQMRPEFGSRLHELVFNPADSSTRALISHYVNEALLAWEPRIDVLAVDISDGETGTLLVNIEYKVKATNSTFNMVYPFYLAEGREAAQ